jgi:hypothetical protein
MDEMIEGLADPAGVWPLGESPAVEERNRLIMLAEANGVGEESDTDAFLITSTENSIPE